MSNYQSRRAFGVGSAVAVATEVPDACPGCRSSSIATTSKRPTMESYWRCLRCGEIWNAARRHALTGRAHG